MAMQNNYNNYIKRQKQNSTGMFKEKVKNSLGGVAVGNNTTKKTPAMMGQTAQNTLGVSNAPKPTVPKIQSQGYKTVAKPYSMSEHITNPTNAQNVLQSNIQAPKPTPQPTLQPTTPQAPVQTPAINPVNTPVDAPVETPIEGGEGVGMMSLADINNAISVDTSNQETTPQEQAEIEALANTPEVQMMAYASKKKATKKKAKKKTPQEIAKEILEQQKAQAQKDWKLKQEQLKKQEEDARKSHELSKKQANEAYKKTEEDLQLNRYKQQQEMNASAVSRGIQYSPQQLGLETVADINLNNNITEASTKRNELLNNLEIELNKVMGNIILGNQEAVNNYNSVIGNLNAEYLDKVANWTYNDAQTEAERKWQAEQTKKDQQFQKEMQEASQKWQSKENALDRDLQKKGRSGGYSTGRSTYSYGGGGGSWRGRSFTPYYNYYGGRGGNNYSTRYYNENGLDLTNDSDAEAYVATAKEAMTDYYNAVNVGGSYDLNDRASAYTSTFKDLIKQTKGLPNSKKVVDELNKTYDVGVKHLRNNTYARDTNTPIKIGDTLYKSSTPVRESYIAKKTLNKRLDDVEYYSKFARTKKERKGNEAVARFQKSTGVGKTLDDLKKFNAKKSSSAKKNTPTKKKVNSFVQKNRQKTATKQSFKNQFKKNQSNLLKPNAKKKPSTVRKNPRTQAKRTQSKFQKSFNNLKKNIKKLFGWR